MLESFFIHGPLPLTVEKGTYQLPLVVLSYVVASFASYTALALAQSLLSARSSQEKRFLHWGGAFAMGAGIWSMHFIGMLSYKMRMVMEYDPWLTLLSLLIAIFVAYWVLRIVARERLPLWQTFIGAVLLGFGICSMHYTGMAAMKMEGDLRYIPSIFLLSVAIAIAASAAALWMAFVLARHSSRFRHLFQIGAALVMGGAICGMHYTGMVAAVFIPYADCRFDPNQNFDVLAISIAGITTIILSLALMVGSYRKTQAEFQLQSSETKLRAIKGLMAAIVESSDDAIISKDLNGIITSWNAGAERLFGYKAAEMIGHHIGAIIPPECQLEERHILASLREGKSIINLETVRRNKDGRNINISLTVSPIRNEAGEIIGASKSARDITERKKTEEQLRITLGEVIIANQEADEARKKAEVASQVKSDFLANMSHEVRTPLNSMLGLSELLLETELGSQQEQHIRTIMHSGETLLEIINDLLDLSKIESGKLELDPVPFDLQAAIDDTVELFAPKAREKEQQLELLVNFTPGTSRYVIGDQIRIRQILSNLLANAIKFTQAGYILVTAQEIHENMRDARHIWIRVTVQDTGIGIPQNKLNLIFEKFSQADVSTTRKFGGTGLGLSICRQLARMMKGDVTAQSVQGKGSTFSVMLSLERDPAPHEDAPSIDRALLKGKRALIVDDVVASQTILTAQLAGVGIQSSCTGNAKTALAMLAEAKNQGTPFDMLVTDYILPEMESDAFTKQAKTLYPDMPVIMVTAFAEKGYAQIFASAGCDAYFTKPVRTAQLLDLLAMIFEAKRSGKHISMLTPGTVFRKNGARPNDEDTSFLEGAEILLVEDHRANRELVFKLLENFGCRATAARNGEEAIAIAKQKAFDLILMDCQMPEMDGFEASQILCAMKKRHEITDMPIIALTANAMKGDREKCLEFGMNDYLTKPLRKASLRNALMQWLPPKEKRVTTS